MPNNSGHIFAYCTALKTLTIDGNPSNVTRTARMFFTSPSLTTVDFSNWDMSNLNDVVGMLSANSESLTIYVKDNNAKIKLESVSNDSNTQIIVGSPS